MALRISNQDFNEKVFRNEKLVLVEFYSDSCVPCKKIACILGDLEEELEDKIVVYKVNINYEDELIRKYDVMSSPTVMFFQNGLEETRVTGTVRKEVLREIILDFIKNKGD